jgi:hypothetical protein
LKLFEHRESFFLPSSSSTSKKFLKFFWTSPISPFRYHRPPLKSSTFSFALSFRGFIKFPVISQACVEIRVMLACAFDAVGFGRWLVFEADAKGSEILPPDLQFAVYLSLLFEAEKMKRNPPEIQFWWLGNCWKDSANISNSH